MTPEEVRAELVRSRGFIRGAETQLTKSIAALDELVAGLPAPIPEPEPEPEPTPEPEPPPPGPSWQQLRGIAWEHSLGNTDAALTDGGNALPMADPRNGGCPWRNLSIVDGAPLAFPGRGGVLRVPSNAGCGHVTLLDRFPAPAPGVRWRAAWWFQNGLGQGDLHNHGPCDLWPMGDIQMIPQGIYPVAGQEAHNPGFHFRNSGLGNPWLAIDAAGARIAMPNGRWYVHGFEIEWDTPTSFLFLPFIRETPTGPDLQADWLNQSGGNVRLSGWYASGERVRPSNPALCRSPAFGIAQSRTGAGCYYTGDVQLEALIP